MESNVFPSWSSLAWRGFFSILFGIAALAWPGVTLAALTMLFGAYAFVDGVFALIIAFRKGQQDRALLTLDGVIGIGAGVLTAFWPGITLLALIFIIGARALIMGGIQIAAAIRLRRLLPSPVLLGLGGLAAIVLGVLAFATPGITALALVTMLGVYALVFGVAIVILAFRVRRETHRPSPPRGYAHAG